MITVICVSISCCVLQMKSPPSSLASSTATAPVPGQNVNSKPFTSQLTKMNPQHAQPPVNQPSANMPGPQRFPTMTFNSNLPPNTAAAPQQFNNKFNNFNLPGIYLMSLIAINLLFYVKFDVK